MPVPDKEQDIRKGSDVGKDKQTDFTDKTGIEKEKTPDKTASQETPISGKDKFGLDIDVGKGQEVDKGIGKDPGKDTGKEKPMVGSKDKISGKDPDDSMNTVRKKASDNGKIVQYLNKDGDLDIAEKVVIDPTNDLDTNIVDIVLIEDKGTIKETNLHKAPEKDNKETVTEIPQYTIVSLRKDEKDENVPYKIDTSSTSNTSETVDSNDIEESLQTMLPKETPKIQLQAHEDNSTERTIVPTLGPDTERVTSGEARQGVDHEKTTGPDPESPIKEKSETDMGTRPETESRHTEKDVENLSIIGNLRCLSTSWYKTHSKYIECPLMSLFSLFLSEAEGRKCPPPPGLYHGFYEWVPGADPELVEFFCNHSYALSGSARRTCQPNGTWSNTQPICVRGMSWLSAFLPE